MHARQHHCTQFTTEPNHRTHKRTNARTTQTPSRQRRRRQRRSDIICCVCVYIIYVLYRIYRRHRQRSLNLYTTCRTGRPTDVWTNVRSECASNATTKYRIIIPHYAHNKILSRVRSDNVRSLLIIYGFLWRVQERSSGHSKTPAQQTIYLPVVFVVLFGWIGFNCALAVALHCEH